MGLQPSASRTALLLACPRPFDDSVEKDIDIPGEPSRYGSAFHQIIATCLKRDILKTRGAKRPGVFEKTDGYAKEVDKAAAAYDVRAAAAELAGHVKSSVGVLRNWLEREKLEVAEVETPYAVKPYGSWAKARPIDPHDEDHKYAVEEGEMPGTVDLIAASADGLRAVVIDHKTGAYATENFATPAKMPQMRTLGLVRGEVENVEVGIFHADRMGLPMIYSEPYEPADRRAHASKLHAALGLVGSGFLRAGAHCGYCPVRSTCPAHTAELISETTETLVRAANAIAVEPLTGLLAPKGSAALSLEDRAGALYELLKKTRALDKAGSAEIKRMVREGAVIETREGKTLAIQTQTYETLSMKSIREALGKVAGEKVIDKLRKQGAVRESTRDMLVGEK